MVHESPGSRDYNIEGTAELTLEADTAGRPETTGRMLSMVAGGRYTRVCRLSGPLNLPVFGKIGRAA